MRRKSRNIKLVSAIMTLSLFLGSCAVFPTTKTTTSTTTKKQTKPKHSLQTPTTEETEATTSHTYLIGEKKANIMMRKRPTPLPTPEPTDEDGNRVIDYYNKDDRKKAVIRFDRNADKVTTTTMKETSRLTTTTTQEVTQASESMTQPTDPNNTSTKSTNTNNSQTKSTTSKVTTSTTTQQSTVNSNSNNSKNFQINSGYTFTPLASGTVVELSEQHLFWRNDTDQFRLSLGELIYQGLLNRQEKIELSSIISKYKFKEDPINIISVLVFSIKDTDPRFFFYEQPFSYNYYYNDNGDGTYTFSHYSLNFKYQKAFNTVAKQEAMWATINNTAWQMANEIKSQTTDLVQMYKLVHDRLARYSYYSPSANTDKNNAYGALVDTETMCVGYALAFQMVANRLGGTAITVYGFGGTQDDGEYHNWNMVKAGNNWYHLDVTWDDFSTNGDFSSKNPDPTVYPMIAYFMRSDRGASDHQVYSYARPAANDDFMGAAPIANSKEELKALVSDFFKNNRPNPKASVGINIIVNFKISSDEYSKLLYDAYFAAGVDYSCLWLPIITENNRALVQLLPHE